MTNFRVVPNNGIEVRAALAWWREWKGRDAGLYLVGLPDVLHRDWPCGHMARLDRAVVDDFGNLRPVEV